MSYGVLQDPCWEVLILMGGGGGHGRNVFFGLKMLYVIYQTDLAVAYGDFSIMFTAVLPSSQ